MIKNKFLSCYVSMSYENIKDLTKLERNVILDYKVKEIAK